MMGRLVVFGATGDLTGRFLLPALAQLSAAGELPHGFSVIGAARARYDDDAFRVNASDQLEQHAGGELPPTSGSAGGRTAFRSPSIPIR